MSLGVAALICLKEHMALVILICTCLSISQTFQSQKHIMYNEILCFNENGISLSCWYPVEYISGCIKIVDIS